MKRVLILLTMIVAFSNASFSQVPELNPVLISSSMQQKRIRETGRNIAILTKEDIKNIPANSLDELLRFVPGIEVQQRGPQGCCGINPDKSYTPNWFLLGMYDTCGAPTTDVVGPEQISRSPVKKSYDQRRGSGGSDPCPNEHTTPYPGRMAGAPLRGLGSCS